MKNWYDYLDRFEPPAKDSENENHPPLSQWEKNVLEPQDTLDLHGLDRESALRRLDQFLQGARHRNLKKILVIHGKGLHSAGEGVLKTSFLRWVAAQKGIKVKKAPARWGGSGASLVFLI